MTDIEHSKNDYSSWPVKIKQNIIFISTMQNTVWLVDNVDIFRT